MTEGLTQEIASSALAVHALFDVLAWFSAFATMWLLRRGRFSSPAVPTVNKFSYLTAVIFGAAIGAYIFGTLNLYLSGQPGIARSIAGALAGAIISIEIYKKAAGITGRTGAIYAAPVAVGIMVGRIGCHFSGIKDFTYGIATGGNFGHDFGDGILRYPVQLAESSAMLAFLAIYLTMMARKSQFWRNNGFYLIVGWYGVERFVLEFWKPYGAAVAGMSVFQILSVVFLAYSVIMSATNRGNCTRQ